MINCDIFIVSLNLTNNTLQKTIKYDFMFIEFKNILFSDINIWQNLKEKQGQWLTLGKRERIPPLPRDIRGISEILLFQFSSVAQLCLTL